VPQLPDIPSAADRVRHVYAVVSLVRAVETYSSNKIEGSGGLSSLQEARVVDADNLNLNVKLIAEDDAGKRIGSQGSFKIGGGRRGLAAVWWRYHGPPLPRSYRARVKRIELTYKVDRTDIEDSINQMLGRDPDLHRPPLLAWHDLIVALSRVDIYVTEDALITKPLTVELDAAVQTALAQ
jgi:hypothetical protein